MKITSIITLLFLLVAGRVSACRCGTTTLLANYQRADFVATAKILKIIPDSKNKDRHDVEIELIKLYKGQPLTKLKIFSSLRSSCAFMPEENSTWLILASEWSGVIGFGFCSGGFQLDEKFDQKLLKEYPNALINYNKKLKVQLDILDYLSGNKITDPNKYALYFDNPCTENLKGYRNKDRFAVYEITVNPDLTVASVKALKRFENRALAKKLLKCLKSVVKIGNADAKPIPEKTKLIVVYYFYDSDRKDKSFVSFFDG